MPRYKLVVEYDGTPFTGWQHQTNGLSVQQAVEDAIARFTGSAVRVHCAGRTDSGVHATHQVIHVDLEKEWRPDTVRDATNAHLKPAPVAILSALVGAPASVLLVAAVLDRGLDVRMEAFAVACTVGAVVGPLGPLVVAGALRKGLLRWFLQVVLGLVWVWAWTELR